MTLNEWADKNGPDAEKMLAGMLGVSKNYVWRLLNGSRYPSRELALKIEETTCGAVSRMEALYPCRKAE